MSTENQSTENVQLDLLDLINAAQIMEAAVSRNAFQLEELGQVAPVVAKFVKFANQVIEAEKAKQDTDASTAGGEDHE